MQIIDYVIIGVVALFLVIGLWRGMVKMAFGLLAGIAALVIAIMLCSTVAGALVSNTGLDDQIAKGLHSSITVGNNSPLIYDATASEDVLGYYVVNAEGANEFKKFSTLFEGNIILQILAGPMESGIRGSYTPEVAATGARLASDLIASWIAVLIVKAICFVLLWILAAVILKVISILLKKFVSATFIGHFIDRVFGGVMGVAVAGFVVLLVFTVFGMIGKMSFMEPVIAHIDSSVIGKLLYDNNFIYKLLSAQIDFSSIFSGVSAASMLMMR